MRHSARPDQPVSVLGRICAILDAYGPDDTVLALPVLRARTGLPKATVHRLAHELAANRLLEATDRGFRLGGRLVELGAHVHPRARLRDVAMPHLEDLYEATRLTVQLAVVEDDAAVLVTRLTGRGEGAVPCRAGDRLPLVASAIGSALSEYGRSPTGNGAGHAGHGANGSLDGIVVTVTDDADCGDRVGSVDTAALAAPVRAAALAIAQDLRLPPGRPVVEPVRIAEAVAVGVS